MHKARSLSNVTFVPRTSSEGETHDLQRGNANKLRCNEDLRTDRIRRDALQRHEGTHNANPSLLQRGGRACIHCAAAKARCSGDPQCTRCRERGVQCSYPVRAEAPTPSTSHGTPPTYYQGAQQIEPQYRNQGEAPSMPQHTPNDMPSMIGPPATLNDFEFTWDQNILSSTNWLEALPSEYGQYNFDGFPAFGGLAAGHQRFPEGSTRSQGLTTESPASVFSTHSNAVAGSTTSHDSHGQGPARTGEFYVDGEHARLPRVKRRKTSISRRPMVVSGTHDLSLKLPDDLHKTHESCSIDDSVYHEIQGLYRRNCIEPPTPWPPYEPVAFPAKEVLEHFLGLYFKHFDQSLPFLHRGTFHNCTHESTLIIAMASIGCQYLPEEVTSPVLIGSMHEMVRRCILYVKESIPDAAARAISGGAAEVLHLVGSAFRGDKRLLDSALDMRKRLAEVFADCTRKAEAQDTATSATSTTWLSWARRESNVRLAYAAWVLDATFAYQFQLSPYLSLREAHLPLPCSDKIWLAESEQQWRALSMIDLPQPSLNTALQELFVDKRLPRDRGEFARIITIHGIYSRIWEVSRYLEDPLSHWVPTARRQTSADLLPKNPIWLPAIPAFVKWQNSACDALDVLHWQANASIGMASGLEHPTVLHLHIARVVLLAPYERIVSLARHTAKGTAHTEAAKADQQLIQRWAVHHQYKARLSVIHAGVAFWHVRRYTIDAFHEAPAIGLAALTLWAFGTFTNRQPTSTAVSHQPDHEALQTSEQRAHESDDGDDTPCDIILIDRPTDDELVQAFIRNGDKMQAHLTGVGDLYAVHGPERALEQACKLLGSLRCWGISDTWLVLLQGLVTALRQGQIIS